MQTNSHNPGDKIEWLNLREQAWPLYVAAQVLGVVGLVATVLLGYFADDNFRRFFFSYLIEFMFFLAIALGGLFFVLLQHATKAGWSVNIRRIAEWFASSLPMMAVLSAPIFIAVALSAASFIHGHRPAGMPPASRASISTRHFSSAGWSFIFWSGR